MGYLLRYQSEFTELAKSRFLDCESCGMTQGALIRNVADRQALYMQAKQPRSDILYMTTLDTGRCSQYVYMYMCITSCIYEYMHICICVYVYVRILRQRPAFSRNQPLEGLADLLLLLVRELVGGRHQRRLLEAVLGAKGLALRWHRGSFKGRRRAPSKDIRARFGVDIRQV